jgi:putative transposase
MSYTSGSHTVFHHRYHIVWITKYRYKVLEGALRERIRTIIRQVCKELGVQIVSGVSSREHVHMFVDQWVKALPLAERGSGEVIA